MSRLNKSDGCNIRSHLMWLIVGLLLLTFATDGICALEKGSKAPSFTLSKIDGGEVSLKNYQDQLVLLYFWDFSEELFGKYLPELEAFYQKIKNSDATLLLIALEDTPEINQIVKSQNLTFPILIDPEKETIKVYPGEGSPFGYIIDHGLIKDYAVGGDALSLQESILASLSYATIDGIWVLKKETNAPPFTLSKIDGGEVSLKDYKDQPVLLYFWDFSEEAFLPELEAFYQKIKNSGASLLLITPEYTPEVKKIVESKGLTFPILLDPTGEIIKAYNPGKKCPLGYIIQYGFIKDYAIGGDTLSLKEIIMTSLSFATLKVKTEPQAKITILDDQNKILSETKGPLFSDRFSPKKKVKVCVEGSKDSKKDSYIWKEKSRWESDLFVLKPNETKLLEVDINKHLIQGQICVSAFDREKKKLVLLNSEEEFTFITALGIPTHEIVEEDGSYTLTLPPGFYEGISIEKEGYKVAKTENSRNISLDSGEKEKVVFFLEDDPSYWETKAASLKEILPKDDKVYYNLGRVYWKEGERTGGRKYFAKSYGYFLKLIKSEPENLKYNRNAYQVAEKLWHLSDMENQKYADDLAHFRQIIDRIEKKR
ncbi:MAG: redoxin domain-containing protein [bacterium]|nr:redoxin domain-containing protein [bacterium]